MTSIKVTSPTRVDLAGGTLDCWPLYNLVAPCCVTVNFSIGICSQVELEPWDRSEVHIVLEDLNYSQSFSSSDELLTSDDGRMKIIKGMVEYFNPPSGFSLKTRSQSPVGAGLGGSSSMTVSLLKAFGQWLERKWTLLQIVEIAHNLESKMIHAPTGTQDYFPAVESMLHFIHYTVEGPRVESLAIPKDLFTQHMSLVYTGVPHQSGINNWQVIKKVIEGDLSVLSVLRTINQISLQMKNCLKAQEWEAIPDLLEKEFKGRVALTPHFSSPRIEELRNVVLSAGAQAVKICGAGGGGCVVVWSQPEQKKSVEVACRNSGFEILPLNLHQI